MNVVNRLCCL